MSIFSDVQQLDRDGEPYTAKRLRICDLPHCYYKTRLIEMVDDHEATLWVVGKPGNELVGDWAAYIGHPHHSAFNEDYKRAMQPYAVQGLWSPEGTCSFGDKLPADIAVGLFPEYEELTYRY